MGLTEPVPWFRILSGKLHDSNPDCLRSQVSRCSSRRGGPVLRDEKRLIFGVNRHRAWQIVKDCAEKAGLPKLVNPETGRVHNVSPHRLRDCFAVMAVHHDDSTDGVRMLQEWLGHTHIGTTMRYRKVAARELKDWYEKLWPRKEEGNG